MINHCRDCGSKLKIEDEKETGLLVLSCSKCEKEFFSYSHEDLQILEPLINEPVQTIERVSAFLSQIKEIIRKIARQEESNVQNSIIDKDVNLTFRMFSEKPNKFQKAFNIEEIDLVKESLILYDQGRIDVKGRLHEELNILERNWMDFGRQDRNILIELYKSFPEETVEASKNIRNTEIRGHYNPDKKSIILQEVSKEALSSADTIPNILRPLFEEKSTVSKKFRALLCHELTHAWLDYKMETSIEDDELEAINEIFAYFTNWVYTSHKFVDADTDLYSRPDLIRWGVVLLTNKRRELEERGMKQHPIDFARSAQLKVYKAAANRDKNRYEVFLRSCLYKKDKRRLQELRRIDGFLEEDFRQLRNLLINTRKNVSDKKDFEEINEVIRRLEWNDPKKLEMRLLKNIKKNATCQNGTYEGLEEISSRIENCLKRELDNLESCIKCIELTKNYVNDNKTLQRLNKFEKDIDNTRKKISSLI